MKLENEIASSKDYLKKLNRDLKKKVTSKQVEIKNTEDFYNLKKKEVEQEGFNKVQVKKISNDDRLIREGDLASKRIKVIKDRTKEQTDKIIEGLEVTRRKNNDQLEEIQGAHTKKVFDKRDRFEEVAGNITYKNRNEFTKLKSETDLSLLLERDNAKNLIESENKKTAGILEVNSKDFLRKKRERGLEYSKNLSFLEQEQSTFMNKLKNKNMIEKVSAGERHKGLMLKEDEYQKNLLEQRKSAFKLKYDQMVKSQEDLLNGISKRNINEIEGLKKSYEAEKKQLNDKSVDKFYRVLTLNPILKENPDSYEVSIKVPQHERDMVNLTGDTRSILVTQTRRFSDKTIDENGDTNSTSKSEVFSKRFTVPDIIDAKKLNKKYENGTLTYFLPKL